MKMIALVYGIGEGCDYTIGCNKTWWELKATNMGKAIEEVKAKLRDYGECDYGAKSIGRVQILSVTAIDEMDLNHLRQEAKTKLENEERQKTERQERGQLEALKQNYEKSK